MEVRKKIYLVGAHGGYASLKAPLGGGATVFESMIHVWKANRNIGLGVLSPGPEYRELHPWMDRYWKEVETDLKLKHPASLDYLQYARFSRAFERATTEFLLERDAQECWVIANDICEGPNVLRLKKHGYRVMTLVHVDVVEFIANLYLKRTVSPHILTHFWRKMRFLGLTRMVHDIGKLIFDKQEDAYEYSDYIIVPSEPMREVVRKCYPQIDLAKIKTIPWGYPSFESTLILNEDVKDFWRKKWSVPDKKFVFLSLSRISPEKGIDRVLKGLIELERKRPDLAGRCCYLIAGSAAYMDGPRYFRKLEKLSKSLKKVQVVFLGHLSGEAKGCAFQIANLYVFYSLHESYGLTLSEALNYRLPALVSPEAARGSKPVEGVMLGESHPKGLAENLIQILEGEIKNSPSENPGKFEDAAMKMEKLMGI